MPCNVISAYGEVRKFEHSVPHLFATSNSRKQSRKLVKRGSSWHENAFHSVRRVHRYLWFPSQRVSYAGVFVFCLCCHPEQGIEKWGDFAMICDVQYLHGMPTLLVFLKTFPYDMEVSLTFPKLNWKWFQSRVELFKGWGGMKLNFQCYRFHYCDVIMRAMAFQTTDVSIVYSIVWSGVDQRKHQSSASLAFVRRIHWWPVKSPHKGSVTCKMFPFDDVIMYFSISLKQKPLYTNWL